ncbi:hypothetical protein [Pseudomonas sp. URIL14HWK12:I5]|uniref:hypothetical protein n=1 Tax=Pseudomonas sp. URIL14HWK12:I5 TaxID=1261630 RepID=UPI0009D7E710|nr:hypothetical protein [Pseudomonas sp. URIL14HWK12:I5]SMC57999.1 hypothetical protein SAMN05660385_01446 [Pseudomonas sp. URIL14HWK12:I5]
MDNKSSSGANSDLIAKLFAQSFRSASAKSTSSSSVSSNIPTASSNPSPQVSTSVDSEIDANKKIDDYMQVAFAQVNAKLDELYKEKATFISQAERKVAKMLRDSTGMMNSIQASLDSARELTEKSIETQIRLQEEVSSIKGNAVSALSIFVSFFAFITVSINVFSKAQNVAAACGLVLVFWCLLIGFNVLIGWQFNTLRHSGIAWFVLVVVLFLSFVSMIAMYHFAPDLVSASKSVM